MGGSVMFSCRTILPLDVKALKKVSLKYKAESETVVPKKMEHSAYVPRVENISPALPVDEVKDDATLQVSKDDLLNQITNIDKQITQTESEIKSLGTKLLELKKAADESKAGSEEEEVKKPHTPTLAIKIYFENKRKLKESATLWEKLGPKIIMPLYNQPSDTSVYHENRKKHLVFRYCLLKALKSRYTESSLQENYLIALYMEKKQDWLNKVKAIESSLAHKKKEAEKKIIFEREFPKLRKQIEEKRKQRLSQLESHFGTGDKSKSACAVICPILLPSRQQEFRYINNNGLIKDLPTEFKEWQLINVWTEAEKAIFKEKFLQHPKQFGIIASYLDHKNISECIKYYYQSKQTENYKNLLRKTRKRAHMNCNGLPAKRANVAQLNSGKALGAQTGTATCLQAEKEVRRELYGATVENGEVEQTEQISLPQSMQPSLLGDVASTSSSLPAPAVVSDVGMLHSDVPTATPVAPPTVEQSVETSHIQDRKTCKPTESTFENTEFRSNILGSSVTECEINKHEEEEVSILEEMPVTSKKYKSFETKTDFHNGIVQSIVLDHSKHLLHSEVPQYSMCEERALHNVPVPSTCSSKLRSCYNHGQVLIYQNPLNQAQHSSMTWTDSHQKQGTVKDSEVIKLHVHSESSGVGTGSERYIIDAPKNFQPNVALQIALNKESSVPETAVHTWAHNIEKPQYGSQNQPAVSKSSEEVYRSLVIKTTARCDEGPNRIENSMHNQPVKLGNGIVKPVTSVAEDVSAVGAASKQVHSVKDLVMEVIEKQIMKNFGRYDDSNCVSGEGKGALAPTLSSILQTQHLAGRNQPSFAAGFQVGNENRNVHLSQELPVPTSNQTIPPMGQKQHTLPVTTYQVIANNTRLPHEYLPEGKETSSFLGTRNFQGNVEVTKHRFPVDTVIASHQRPPPLLPTAALHQKHYPLTTGHQVGIRSTPHSSAVYLPRGNVSGNHVQHQVPVQDSDGTLDLSTKRLRAYHPPPGLLREEFPLPRSYQTPTMEQLSSHVSNYLSRSGVPAMQRKVHPQELMQPVSSASTSAHRNRYASVISQSVIVREQAHNFSGEQSVLPDDCRVAISTSGSSNVGLHAPVSQVEAMANIYKPYFP